MMQRMTHRFDSFAKINLSLKLLGRRSDGFTEIESLIVPIALHDEIQFTEETCEAPAFTCDDPSLPTGPDNLVVRAIEKFHQATGLPVRWSVHLSKRIPHGAGLGGGSGNAATTLAALNSLEGTPLTPQSLHSLAAELGSDVPFFLIKGPAFARGRGEILEKVDVPEMPLLLVKPGFGVETAWAYKRWHAMNDSESHPPTGDESSWEGFTLRNDMEPPVFEKYPLLAVARDWLAAHSESGTSRMSGSGSTLFALGTSILGIMELKEKFLAEFGENWWVWHGRTLD